jgi:hypothetical protein
MFKTQIQKYISLLDGYTCKTNDHIFNIKNQNIIIDEKVLLLNCLNNEQLKKTLNLLEGIYESKMNIKNLVKYMGL